MRPTSIGSHPSLLLLHHSSTSISSLAFKQLHSHLLTTGLALHSFPLSLLLRLAPSVLGPCYATALLRCFPRTPTTFLFNTLLSSLAPRHPSHAWNLYCRLVYREALRPNSHTYPSLLKACGSPGSTSLSCFHGRVLHAHVVKLLGSEKDRFVQVGLLGLYSRCKKIGSCRQLFDEMPQPDLASWNCMLGAYIRAAKEDGICGSVVASGSVGNGLCLEVLGLFNKMLVLGVKPDEISLVAVIGACGDLGNVAQGVWTHAYAVRKDDLAINRHVGTALIDMYVKCGCLELACQVFGAMGTRDTACYNAMINGLAAHGHGNHALELFNKMRNEGLKTNDATMVAVMFACSHAGLVDEGRRIFHDMEDDYGVERKVEHYGCLVDLLGRAGLLEEAGEVIRKMPMLPTAMIYRSLLAAYKIHDKMAVRENMLQSLIEVEPCQGGNYVLQSTMYAKNDKWSDVKLVREAMTENGVSKNPGVSLVEIDGCLHEFRTGDTNHVCSVEIYDMIATVSHWLQD